MVELTVYNETLVEQPKVAMRSRATSEKNPAEEASVEADTRIVKRLVYEVNSREMLYNSVNGL